MMNGVDNQFTATDKVSHLIDRGGIESAIWMWPVDKIAAVLVQLYDGRERTKAVIYELTGLSDIVRGSSKASETLGAQQIKSQYAGLRVGNLQQAVQQFIRESLKITADMICEKFQLETLRKMTGLPYPTQAELDQQYQMQMMQYQQAASMAQMGGQQPPQPPQKPQGQLTWDQIMTALRDNPTRSYKVDIETDSTIAATLKYDADSLQQLGAAISGVTQAIGPLVQEGVLPVEGLKEVLLAVSRRARLGNAVEDAFDNMKEPQAKQADQSGAQDAQANIQMKQMELASNQQIEQARIQSDKELKQMELDSKKQTDIEVEAIKAQASIQVAEINAGAQIPQNFIMELQSIVDKATKDAGAAGNAGQELAGLMQALTAPKQVTLQKDGMGRTIGAVTGPVQNQGPVQ